MDPCSKEGDSDLTRDGVGAEGCEPKQTMSMYTGAKQHDEAKGSGAVMLSSLSLVIVRAKPARVRTRLELRIRRLRWGLPGAGAWQRAPIKPKEGSLFAFREVMTLSVMHCNFNVENQFHICLDKRFEACGMLLRLGQSDEISESSILHS